MKIIGRVCAKKTRGLPRKNEPGPIYSYLSQGRGCCIVRGQEVKGVGLRPKANHVKGKEEGVKLEISNAP